MVASVDRALGVLDIVVSKTSLTAFFHYHQKEVSAFHVSISHFYTLYIFSFYSYFQLLYWSLLLIIGFILIGRRLLLIKLF